MTRDTPQVGIDLIKKREVLELRVYDDKHPDVQLTPASHVEGRLTGGWGHTGPDVVIGMQVTPDLATHWFGLDLRQKVEIPIWEKIGAIVFELTENQYGALCCFVFNLGTGNPKNPEWTIWSRLRAKQFDQVPIEMIRFVNWNGKRSQGLVNRRNDEIALWCKDIPLTGTATDPRSSVTQAEATPPTPTDPTPATRSGTIITAIATAAATAPSAVNQAIQAVAPYSDHSEVAGHVVAILSTVGAVLAIAGVFLVWFNHRRTQH